MRVFLDTNVLASAFGTRGLCEDVLREVLASHDLLISDSLFLELQRVLAGKFSVPSRLVADILALLKQDTIHVHAGDLPTLTIKDTSDLILLSAALEGQADVFVTGDKELLAVKKVGRLPILSPRAFWEQLRGSKAK